MAASATEWQRLERDQQDGAHQQLVAIGVHLRSLQHQLGRDSRRTERSTHRKHRGRRASTRRGGWSRGRFNADQGRLRLFFQRANLQLAKGKRRPRRVSVTTSLATATRQHGRRPALPREGGWARRREVPRSHSVPGRGGAIRPRTGEPRYFLSLYRRPVRRRRRNHTTAPCRPATEDIKHLH